MQSQQGTTVAKVSTTETPVQKPAVGTVVTIVKEKTVKQKLIEFLNSQGEKYPKNATLNSLVERFQAKYPDYMNTLGFAKKEVNLADNSSLTDFDPSLDDFEKSSIQSLPVKPKLERREASILPTVQRILTLESRFDELEENVKLMEELIHGILNKYPLETENSETFDVDVSKFKNLTLTLY